MYVLSEWFPMFSKLRGIQFLMETGPGKKFREAYALFTITGRVGLYALMYTPPLTVRA